MSHVAKLHLVRLLHTAIWTVMASAILALPWIACTRHFRWAAAITALVILEGIVLLLNHGRCPLTDVAARYTSDRRDNFDIYLPLWLAKHNKTIFTALFVAGEVVVGWKLVA